VSVYGPDRHLRWSAQRELAPLALPDEERQQAATVRAAIAKRRPEVAEQLEVPTVSPQVNALCVDLDGNLWVQFASSKSGLRLADVYDSTGHLRVTRVWTQEVEMSLCAAHAERALGVATDSLGLQHVMVLHFAKGDL
jgi:hypothetical protein